MLMACVPQEPVFSLKGELKGQTEQSFILKMWGKNGYEILDTVCIVKGKIDYTRKLDQPVLITLESNRKNRVSFLGNNTSYSIHGYADGLSTSTITGGVLQDEYNKVNTFKSERQEELRLMSDAYRAAIK